MAVSDRRLLLVLALVILLAILVLGWPGVAGGQQRGRVTVYHQQGITASGVYTDVGVLSCSYTFPMYTHLTITAPDGTQFHGVCLDRGLLDHYGVLVDVFLPWGWGDWWRNVYGDYPTVEIDE